VWVPASADTAGGIESATQSNANKRFALFGILRITEPVGLARQFECKRSKRRMAISFDSCLATPSRPWADSSAPGWASAFRRNALSQQYGAVALGSYWPKVSEAMDTENRAARKAPGFAKQQFERHRTNERAAPTGPCLLTV
jgi:hypothetical protein